MLTENCGVVLLAAGRSSRMGKPKQLLTFRGKPLLVHAVQAGMGVTREPLVVVGAKAPLLRETLDKLAVQPVRNPEWEKGMASSIRCGLAALLERNPQVDAAIFMVCDQPYITSTHLNAMIARWQDTGKAIVASAYGNTTGTPALFGKSLFPELMLLQGDKGARKIIAAHADAVATVNFPGGDVDIDTLQDYERLIGARS